MWMRNILRCQELRIRYSQCDLIHSGSCLARDLKNAICIYSCDIKFAIVLTITIVNLHVQDFKTALRTILSIRLGYEYREGMIFRIYTACLLSTRRGNRAKCSLISETSEFAAGFLSHVSLTRLERFVALIAALLKTHCVSRGLSLLVPLLGTYHMHFCRSVLFADRGNIDAIRRSNFRSGSFYIHFLFFLSPCTMNSSRMHTQVFPVCIFTGVHGSDGFRCFTKCDFPQCLRDVHSYRYNVTYRYAICDSQVTFDANNGACTSYGRTIFFDNGIRERK